MSKWFLTTLPSPLAPIFLSSLSRLVIAGKLAEFEIISSVKKMGNTWESSHSWETISAIHASTFADKVHLLFYPFQLGSRAELMERRRVYGSGPPTL